jgi:hypothetical protein
MFFRRSAWILFLLALLSQLGAPVARAGLGEPAAERSGAYCIASHEAARGTDAPGSAAGHARHSHAYCSACPFGAGAAPIAALPLSICYDREIHGVAAFFATEASVSRAILKHGAAPRAPPAGV